MLGTQSSRNKKLLSRTSGLVTKRLSGSSTLQWWSHLAEIASFGPMSQLWRGLILAILLNDWPNRPFAALTQACHSFSSLPCELSFSSLLNPAYLSIGSDCSNCPFNNTKSHVVRCSCLSKVNICGHVNSPAVWPCQLARGGVKVKQSAAFGRR